MMQYFLTCSLYGRLLGSFLTAFSLVILLAHPVIQWFRRWQLEQSVRAYVPKSHDNKIGTPTFGGLLIVFSIVVSAFLWNALQEITVLLIATLIGFSTIGGIDDLLKIFRKNQPGLSIRHKYFLQSMLGLCVAAWFYAKQETCIQIFSEFWTFSIGYFFILWVYFVIIGSSNAWNLTDGLDGLAISQTIIIAFSIMLLALFPKTEFLSSTHQAVSVMAIAIIGASLGFLWFNAHPAQVFMGDVGALGLGATLATMAILLQKESAFAFMSIIPIIETLSVIWQIIYFKWTKKRYFLLAPFHHHLELQGWNETKIVARFGIITAFFCTLSILFFLVMN